MKNNKCAILFGILLALSQACHGYGDLKCYVCDNCEKITALTPLLKCDATYFDNTVTTPSTMTTAMIAEDTTTEMAPTTMSTTVVTEALPPTPATVHIPTPPTGGTLPPDAFAVIDGNLTTPPSFMLGRRRRAVVDSEYTYHCYRIQNQVNGSSVISRGCARVTTSQSVCGTLQQADNISSKCYPCSLPRCNGSSAFGVSAIALLLAIVASFLRSQ